MNGFLQFLSILGLCVLASGKQTTQSLCCRKYIRRTQDSMAYNAMFFSVLAVVEWIIFRPTAFYWYTILFGLAIGAIAMLFQVLYSIALTVGPISLTTLIVNFNILIITVTSVLRYHESVSVWKWIGSALLITSLILSCKKDTGGKSASKKWLFLTLTATAATGVASSIHKIYNMEFASIGTDTTVSILIVNNVVSAAIGWILYFIQRAKDARHETAETPARAPLPKMLIYAAVAAVIMCIYQPFQANCMTVIDSIILFPTYTALASLLMILIGVFRFRDRLSRRQWLGVVCGIASVCLMNIG